MSRRITVGLVAGLALLLTACEININYDLLLNSDGSAELETEIVYDAIAAEMLGPPEAFLDELEEDTAEQTPGVTLLDAAADSSDPDAQRVRILLGAEDADALHALVDDTFAGHFIEQESDVYELVLRVEAAEEEFGADMAFIGGSMVVRHDGERLSMTGGEEVDSQTVNWDPTGASDLRMVVDLGAGGSAAVAGGAVLWAVLGLLALLVIGLVVFLIVRRGAGGEATPAAPPMTTASGHEVDAMQTPPMTDHNPMGGQPQHWMPQQTPASEWNQPQQPAPQQQPAQPQPPSQQQPQWQPQQPPAPQQPPGQQQPQQPPSQQPPTPQPSQEPPADGPEHGDDRPENPPGS
jgi:hypothetical protein